MSFCNLGKLTLETDHEGYKDVFPWWTFSANPPHCWTAGTRAVCRRWRSPRGPHQSSRCHSPWWTSCTWCSPEASSGLAALYVHPPEEETRRWMFHWTILYRPMWGWETLYHYCKMKISRWTLNCFALLIENMHKYHLWMTQTFWSKSQNDFYSCSSFNYLTDWKNSLKLMWGRQPEQ